VGRARDIRLAYLLLAPALIHARDGAGLSDRMGRSGRSLTISRPSTTRPSRLENYGGLPADPAFWRAATVTVVFATVTCAVKLRSAGLALLWRARSRRALVFMAIFLPWAYRRA